MDAYILIWVLQPEMICHIIKQWSIGFVLGLLIWLSFQHVLFIFLPGFNFVKSHDPCTGREVFECPVSSCIRDSQFVLYTLTCYYCLKQRFKRIFKQCFKKLIIMHMITMCKLLRLVKLVLNSWKFKGLFFCCCCCI